MNFVANRYRLPALSLDLETVLAIRDLARMEGKAKNKKLAKLAVMKRWSRENLPDSEFEEVYYLLAEAADALVYLLKKEIRRKANRRKSKEEV